MQSLNPHPTTELDYTTPFELLIAVMLSAQATDTSVNRVAAYAQGAGITSLGLEMQYVTPLPGLAPSIGKSSQGGSQASIGGKANCLRPISPFPRPSDTDRAALWCATL